MASPVKPWLDQAGKFPIAHIGGIPHFNEAVPLDAPRTGVLHTTEGGWTGSLAIFKQHFAPHFMLGFDADAQKVRIAQLVQVGTIGAALKAHNNQAIVQIEMIGFSKETPWLPDDETVAALASLMTVCVSEYGIPLDHPWPDGDFGKAGNNPHRSSGKYGKVPGWYGHGDCPSPDTHWDPGNLEWSVILDIAKQMVGAPGAPLRAALAPQLPTPVSEKLGRHVVIARDGLKLRGGPGANFDSERTLPAGTELNVVAVSNVDPAWVRVDLEGDGLLDGYVFAAFLAPAGADSENENAPEPGDANSN